MPGQLQTGTGIGDVVGTTAGTGGTDGSIGDNLHPRTEAGEAWVVAAVALVLLFLLVGKQARGVWAKVVVVALFVVAVMAASTVGHYFSRTIVQLHPGAPGAAGVTFTM